MKKWILCGIIFFSSFSHGITIWQKITAGIQKPFTSTEKYKMFKAGQDKFNNLTSVWMTKRKGTEAIAQRLRQLILIYALTEELEIKIARDALNLPMQSYRIPNWDMVLNLVTQLTKKAEYYLDPGSLKEAQDAQYLLFYRIVEDLEQMKVLIPQNGAWTDNTNCLAMLDKEDKAIIFLKMRDSWRAEREKLAGAIAELKEKFTDALTTGYEYAKLVTDEVPVILREKYPNLTTNFMQVKEYIKLKMESLCK